MATIKGEITWCDYLTPCPFGKDCMVGDFDCCCMCEHHEKVTVLKSIKAGDYVSVGVLEIECNHK
jgi:hypothetical protein